MRKRILLLAAAATFCLAQASAQWVVSDPGNILVQSLREAAAMLLLPCLFLVLFPEKVQSLLLPGFTEKPEDMVDVMVTYSLGGLCAMKEKGAR